MCHRTLAEFKQPTMNDYIGAKVIYKACEEGGRESSEMRCSTRDLRMIQGLRASSKPW